MLSGPHDKEFVYYALNTDVKPTNVIGNSVLYEINPDALTVIKHRFTGTQWIEETVDSAQLTTGMVYIGGVILYICTAEVASLLSDPVWKIKRIDTTYDIRWTWCDGNANYDNIATDLTTVQGHSYS